jgi:hypothetical protein
MAFFLPLSILLNISFSLISLSIFSLSSFLLYISSIFLSCSSSCSYRSNASRYIFWSRDCYCRIFNFCSDRCLT